MCIQNKKLYKNAERKEVKEVDGSIRGTLKGLRFDNLLTLHFLNLQKNQVYNKFHIRNDRHTLKSPNKQK